jgi:lipopolysaccharide transport protein LptA
MNKFLLLLFISIISFLKVSQASEILIESRELIITNDPLTTTFIGNVYAFDEEIKLWSDKILIIFTETDNQIDTIKSFGSTKLIRENQEIISENMTYFVTDEKIYAKGNITLTQDGNVMRGNELTVDLVESTSIMNSDNINKVSVKIINND